jgi:hypothetical protein
MTARIKMNEHKQLARFTLAFVVVVGGSACEGGHKRIGSLDGFGGTEATGDGDGEGDGKVCEQQEIDIEFDTLLPADPDVLLTCAANVVPTDDGYLVTLSHCSDEQGTPRPDGHIVLDGDWPEPELADGEEPRTEVRFIRRTLGEDGYTMRCAILRPKSHSRISLLAFEGTEFLLDPEDVSPLWLSLDEAACGQGPVPCTPETQFQEFPVGFTIGYGDAFGTAAHDMMLSDFGIELGVGTVYDVVVGFAVAHECYEDGDFHELMFGIVARTP